MINKRWLISLVLVLLCVSSTFAQDASQPLILIKAGDLWDWTGGPMLRQKTQWGYNGGILMSPLNDEVAYWSFATITTDAIKREGGFGGGMLPNNIWVITTEATDLAYRPANQPPDASFMTPGKPDKALIRSGAMWSPDATQIAWTENDYPGDGTARLMIYDKATEAVRTVTEGLPPQYGVGSGLYGLWTENGIVLFSYTDLEMTGEPESSIIVIDPASGQIRFTLPLNENNVGANPRMRIMELPIQFQGETWLGVLYSGSEPTSQWELINLNTGAVELVPRGPMGVSTTNPETSLQIFPYMIDKDSIGYNVYQANGTQVDLNLDEDNQIQRFALSPDGQAIAYQLYDPEPYTPYSTIYVWRNGTITTVPQTEFPAIISEFVWGSVTWTLPAEG